jgi:tetratricopeptide (TPR) repeat protein
MLRDLGRLNELEDLLNRALKVESTNKCTLHDEFGSMYELRGEYKKAIQSYKKSIELCLNDKVIEDLRSHIRRCRRKAGFLHRMLRFFRS